ncbi:uncharacterized protein YydD (DUF2326 family) [Bradyrhizobium huanghuaihaiense]|jgi:uncharacterized protein YydD (DUF2326 family)|uniref:DUF2326 domain-containing protein n=3 Tax=Bradyrhizobium TaxID=374 RepID=A0A837C457_9BRAD|nr:MULTISPECIES: DUF2326 domain-containing protein [Bradyrhizobium]APO56169.1 hypothetical protein BD122_37800 [Bradyrhizobium diazoefficiens]KGJ63583.1 hypothetical protein BJA5080_05380 [Bradyrhizobium diazoefficiens SEMIA 5080]KOY05665.1 hypothetical protein AF336_36270 [Bradyrhizobium diazoefficiens]MCD9291570.1 DUF2326 domain-containing protein [Bradyrhizobium diazoefficiens]MCD9809526.1 DUF2326 domain-containing protein [Bradyrhizobium diazoefficiens]
MQISRIYSNKDDLFHPIDFNFGKHADRLNVIFGDVKKPKDKKRDSHNLGKTTLLHLIEFLMLKGTAPEQFLVKHQDRFAGYQFFIEVALNSGEFATIRRGADNPNKVALTKHAESGRRLVDLPDDQWDHAELSREEAVKLLDGWLDLKVLKPYDYRMAITYFLRAQGDFSDELQLQKFQMGKDAHWKPFVAHLFGFSESPVQRKYELDDSIGALKQRQAEQAAEVQYREEDLPKLQAQISVLRQQVEELEAQLDAFEFDAEERRIMKNLVDEVEGEISDINERLYNINYDVRQIDVAMEHKDRFDLDEVATIFSESNILFAGQVKKQYEDLVDFNKKVTRERNAALRTRRTTLDKERVELESRKTSLDQRREQQLRVLRSTDTFDKFKTLQRELSEQKAQLVYLDEQRKKLEVVAATALQVRESERERGRVVDEIKAMVARPTPIYENFSRVFNAYCQRVLSHEGIFYFHVNSNGNFDYTIGLGTPGQTGKTSSQGEGTSYKKLVCALFDLALLKVYEDVGFFHFVYHDGIFEALDDRKKLALLEVVREQTSTMKIQYIMTLIASDLPRIDEKSPPTFAEDEVVLRLHDDGADGRLFKMAEF